MKQWLMSLLVLVGAGPVFASGMIPMDFAKGIVVEGDKDASVCRFTLPEYVYEGMVRHDFGDIRVFNAENEEVPFTLRYPFEERFRKEKPPAASLVMFPVYMDKDQTDRYGRISVRIATDKKGAIIDVNNTPEREELSENPAFYLLDLSALKEKPDRLVFTWENTGQNPMAHIKVEESKDLDHFTPILGSAVLADIRLGNNTLSRDSVDLPFYTAPYVRVTVMDKDTSFRIKGVTGHYSPVRVQDERKWRWTKIKGKPSKKDPFEMTYVLGYALPYERIRISFPQKNTLARVTLKSKDETSKTWNTLYRGLLYNLTMDGTAFEKTEVDCLRTNDTTWVLSIDPEGGGSGKGVPTLELGWIPHTVYFVARGEGPFTVAYGSGKAGPVKGGVNPLLADMDKDDEARFIKEATLNTVVELGGRKQLEIPKGPVPWNRIVLWVILLMGVFLCAWMALSLYRQMGHSHGEDNE